MRRNGFTLIESLVVTTIMAILGAILFPVIEQVTERARQSSCMSNMKQLGMGMLMYVQDYDERFPNGPYIAGGARGPIWDETILHSGWGWMVHNNWRSRVPSGVVLRDVMAPYVRNQRVWRCPSDARKDTWSSYSLKMWLFWYAPTLSQYADPPRYIMFHEEECEHTALRGYNSCCPRTWLNICFVDGHAAFVDQRGYLQRRTNKNGVRNIHWYWVFNLGDF